MHADALGAVAVALWLGAAGAMQPEVRRKYEVERAAEEGRYDDALAVRMAHRRQDFPPIWNLPPRTKGIEGQSRQLAAMRGAISRVGIVPGWVSQTYADKTRMEILWNVGGIDQQLEQARPIRWFRGWAADSRARQPWPPRLSRTTTSRPTRVGGKWWREFAAELRELEDAPGKK